MNPFQNEPILELRRAPVRAQLAGALDAFDAQGTLRVPVWIGEDRREGDALVSTDPGHPEHVVAQAAVASEADVDHALHTATRAARSWGRRSAAERAQVLVARPPSGCASGGWSWPRSRCARPRSRGARPTRDVCEAIDFLEYYARAAVALEEHPAGVPGSLALELIQPPGERNRCARCRAAWCAVISPWNFPRRDPARDGQRRPGHRQRRRPQAGRAGAGAARSRVVRALRESGLPADALSLLPGEGPVGAAAVADPRVHTIAFTGSGAGRAGDRQARRRDGARPAPPQARGRGDGRQELRDRRLRRRPRRRGPGARQVRVRLRRPEVLGRGPRARARGGRTTR